MPVTQLVRVVITVADLEGAASFFRDALGLDVGPDHAIDDPGWIAVLGLPAGTTARGASVSLGNETIALVAFDPKGAPYPVPRASNDQWFQHVALVAGDIEAVWKRLAAAKPEAITERGPARLPPNTGGVTAFKFRDREGHPLELISFPRGVGDPRWQKGGPGIGSGILGYDHTAIAVKNLEKSLAFYTERLGFGVAGRSLNQGPEQDRLDGLTGAQVDVVALSPAAGPTPHVELLHYRTPKGRLSSAPPRADDVASVRQVLRVDGLAETVARLERGGAAFVSPGIVSLQDGGSAVGVLDPDGHMIVALG